nr:hypothetical protein C4D60_Mb02t06470 [Ipomoea trifida]GMC93107.1 hypothetical protein C4D60_Mb02t06470 [Ipomoea batatas]GMD02407.1 hypothetical protein C4D60_Mb02t06470 [Ipomoea batatas]
MSLQASKVVVALGTWLGISCFRFAEIVYFSLLVSQSILLLGFSGKGDAGISVGNIGLLGMSSPLGTFNGDDDDTVKALVMSLLLSSLILETLELIPESINTVPKWIRDIAVIAHVGSSNEQLRMKLDDELFFLLLELAPLDVRPEIVCPPEAAALPTAVKPSELRDCSPASMPVLSDVIYELFILLGRPRPLLHTTGILISPATAAAAERR